MSLSSKNAAFAMTSVFALSAAAIVATVLPGSAQAQDREDVSQDSVLTRQRPEFDPIGVRAGSFVAFPSVRATALYDDNIFATESNEEDDIVLGVQPSINVRSQWARHELNATVDADLGFFVDNNDSNYEDFGISTQGRIDVIGQSAIRFTAIARKGHEERDSPDESGAEDVTDVIDAGFALNYRHVLNRIFIQPGFGMRRRDFDDVGNINNDDRDTFRYAPELRIGYALSPDVAIFASAEVNKVVYDETPNDQGLDRDSEGLGLSLGSEFDLTGKLLGEVQVGYQVQEFEDDNLDDFSGVRANGQITYNLTPLTAFVLNAGAGLEETTVIVDFEQASSIFRAQAGLQLVHELQRNIILSANGSYVRDDFEGVDRTDDRFSAGAGISYSLNRNLSLDLNYVFSTRSSDVDGVDFDRNLISLGLTGRF